MNGWSVAVRRGTMIGASLAIAGVASAAELGVVAVADSVGGYRGNELAYINGGVTRDEADALRNAAPRFPLQLVFSRRGEAGADEFVADAAVSIFDVRGNQVASLSGQGPILLARVPDGRYVIVAEHDGRRQSKQVDVRNGRNRTVNFVWG